jgi:AraC-like DNA-binding protein
MVYKRRILISYIVILVLPIVLNNILLFSSIYRRELDLKSGYVYGNTTQLRNTMDYLISRIRTDIVYLSSRDELRNLNEWFNTSDYREKSNFFRDFDPFARLSEIYDEAFLVHPADNIMLDLKNKLVSPIAPSRQEAMVTQLSRIMERYSGEQDFLLSLPISGTERTYLLRSMTNPTTGNRFYFFVQFNDAFFETLLDDVFMTDDSFVLILNQQNEPVHIRSKTLGLSEDQIPELLSWDSPSAGTTALVDTDDGKFLIARSSSPETAWHYYYGISFRAIRSEIISLLVIFGVLTISLLVLFLVVTFFVARSLYKPVRNIMDLLGGSEDQFESDEFSSIQLHIRELINTNKTLNDSLIHGSNYDKEAFVRDLITKRLSDDDALADQITRYGIDILPPGTASYLVAVCLLKGNVDVTHPNVQKLRIIGKDSAFIEWFNFPDDVHYEAVYTEDSNVVFIISIPLETNGDRITVASLISLDDRIGESVTIGEGSPCRSVAELPRGYKEALVALEYRSLIRDRHVISYADIADHREKVYFYPFDEEQKLITALKRRDAEEVFSHYEHFFEIVLTSGVAFQNLKHVCFHFLDSVLRFTKMFDLPLETLLGEDGADFWDRMEREDDIDEIKSRLAGLLTRLLDMLTSNQASPTFKIAAAVRDVIEANYTDRNLNLDQIADGLKYSVSHISAIFKNHYGETIKNYITSLRLEKAKELLITTDTKISSVGRETGYDNVGSFVKIFKAYLGETPKEFRLRTRST